MPKLGNFTVIKGDVATDDTISWVHSQMFHDHNMAEKKNPKPPFEVSDSLCGSCKHLLDSDELWSRILLHSSLAEMFPSSQACHSCLIFYHALLTRASELGTVDVLNSVAAQPGVCI